MELNPSVTGLLMMVSPVVLSIVAPLSGHLSDKVGSEILTFIGLVGTSVGLYFNVYLKSILCIRNHNSFYGDNDFRKWYVSITK